MSKKIIHGDLVVVDDTGSMDVSTPVISLTGNYSITQSDTIIICNSSISSIPYTITLGGKTTTIFNLSTHINYVSGSINNEILSHALYPDENISLRLVGSTYIIL